MCVSSPALFIRTAACQPAEPKQGGGVCWGPGVRKVRAASMKIRWADLKWMQERASPASQGHGFSARKRRLLEQETQPDRTRKPRSAVTRDGHKCRGRSRIPPLSPLYPPSFTFRWAARMPAEGKKETLESGWFPVELWPTWNLWFPDASQDIKRGFREILMGQSKHRDMLGGEKKQKPCVLPEIHMLLSTATKGQAGRQLKTTARNERRHELKGK